MRKSDYCLPGTGRAVGYLLDGLFLIGSNHSERCCRTAAACLGCLSSGLPPGGGVAVPGEESIEELRMAGKKGTDAVSRGEFYATVAVLSLFPAIVFLTAGNFPESPLRQIAAGLEFLAMVGMSITFSILAIRERRSQTREKGSAAEPGPTAVQPRD